MTALFSQQQPQPQLLLGFSNPSSSVSSAVGALGGASAPPTTWPGRPRNPRSPATAKKMCDPPLALCLYFLRRWLERRPPLPGHGQEDAIFTATSVPAEVVLEDQVSRSTSAFAAHLQSSAGHFLSSNSAIVDVRNLLASSPGRDGAPWASMPIARFTADAAARIHKFVCDCHRVGSLGPDRFLCHLDITAHCARPW